MPLAWPRRGSVYLVRLDPAEGHEIRKTRPAVVVSNDALNELAATVVVMPITTGGYRYMHWITVDPPDGGLTKPSNVVPPQVRCVDKSRLVRRIGAVRPETLRQIEAVIRDTFGLPEGRLV